KRVAHTHKRSCTIKQHVRSLTKSLKPFRSIASSSSAVFHFFTAHIVPGKKGYIRGATSVLEYYLAAQLVGDTDSRSSGPLRRLSILSPPQNPRRVDGISFRCDDTDRFASSSQWSHRQHHGLGCARRHSDIKSNPYVKRI